MDQQAYYKQSFDFANCDEICLVDDDDVSHLDNRLIIHKLYPLKKVVTFTGLIPALHHLRFEPIVNRIVFLDLNMGEDTGFDFLSSLIKYNIHNTKVAILTHSRFMLNKRVAFQFEPVGAYLIKPLSELIITEMITERQHFIKD